MSNSASRHIRVQHLDTVSTAMTGLAEPSRRTLEELAERISDSFARVEGELEVMLRDGRREIGPTANRIDALGELCARYINRFNDEMGVAMIGPVTTRAIVFGVAGGAQLLREVGPAAAMASIATAHLALADYDVRPQTMDGGGGK